MSNPNFRDPAYRDRALRDRNEGIGKAHGSWDKQAAARRASDKRAEAGLDNFDHYVMRWENYVADMIEQSRFDIFAQNWEGFEL